MRAGQLLIVCACAIDFMLHNSFYNRATLLAVCTCKHYWLTTTAYHCIVKCLTRPITCSYTRHVLPRFTYFTQNCFILAVDSFSACLILFHHCSCQFFQYLFVKIKIHTFKTSTLNLGRRLPGCKDVINN